MSLFTSVFVQLGQVLKIVGFICLPLFLIAFLLTTWLHYRRKKRKEEGLEADDSAALVLPAPGAGIALAQVAREAVTGSLTHPVSPDQWPGAEGVASLEQRCQDLEAELALLRDDYARLLEGKPEDRGEEEREWRRELQRKLRQLEQRNARLEQALEYARSQQAGMPESAGDTLPAPKEQGVSEAHLMEKIDSLQREHQLRLQELDSRNLEIRRLEQMLKDLQAAAQIASGESRYQESEWQQRLEEVTRQHYSDKSKYEERIREMQETNHSLQEENLSLQEQLLDRHSGQLEDTEAGPGESALLNRVRQLEAERDRLKSEMSRQHALADITEEKRRQLEFVQQQLDQRIHQYHDLERQAKSWEEKWQQESALSSSLREEVEKLARQAAGNQSAHDALFGKVREQEEQLITLSTECRSLQESLQNLQRENDVYLQKEREWDRQSEEFQASIRSLQDSCRMEQDKAAGLEKRLLHHIELLKQLYEAVIGLPAIPAGSGEGATREESQAGILEA